MPRSTSSSPIAIDASALVELLLQTPAGRTVAGVVVGRRLIAPDIVNAEVVQSLRGLERGGKVSGRRAGEAIVRLADSPVARVPTTGLIAEVWSLRFNLSAYDACYVALARVLGCPLLSTDAPLKRLPSLGVTFL
ncbi:MAG TPA: type II toxin-antitoxin system VapC family toxin [Solirubrobacteraceae bacterium]|jgi:predicted nucleic acid-binding protein|nr:type II toxin-antitoxin system VapC family toxin [Solirubrobacteraceae bacterium]